jgi:serine/threonine protein kinase
MGAPEVLGRYAVTKVIAEGGMGQVLLGRSRQGTPVVLKRLLVDTPMARKRFRDEARMGRRLSFEEGFVETLDAFEDKDAGPVLVLEAIDGVTVEALRKMGPLTDGLVAQIGADVAKALASLHSLRREDGGPLGAVHRDISARNILVDVRGRTKVIDLGASRFDDEDRSARSEVGSIIGTLRYVPPEVLVGGPPSQAGDVWALGLLLLECALGRVFWRGSIQDVAMAVGRRDPMLEPGVERLSTRLRGSLAKLLVREPERRLSAGEAFDELSALAGRFGDLKVALQQAVLLARGELDSGKLTLGEDDVYARLGGVEDDSTSLDGGAGGDSGLAEAASGWSAALGSVRLEDAKTVVSAPKHESGPETEVDRTEKGLLLPSLTEPDSGRGPVSSGVFASTPEPASGLVVEAVSGAVPWPAAPRGDNGQRAVPTEVVRRQPVPEGVPRPGASAPVESPSARATSAGGSSVPLLVGAVAGGLLLAGAWGLGWLG